MPTIELYAADGHRNLLFEDFEPAGSSSVQANQHLIVHGGEALILDPGGDKVYHQVLSEALSQCGDAELKYLFASHQDPDIVGALSGWLMTTDVEVYVSALWLRFLSHVGVDAYAPRLRPIPDQGLTLDLGGCELLVVPAHFLHSPGNFQVYDPVSKILYSGDLGTSHGMDYQVVPDFEAHVPYMEGFHRRHMPCTKALAGWAAMARGLDVETIAPQHGAVLQGKAMCQRFIDWVAELPCGVDAADFFQLPT